MTPVKTTADRPTRIAWQDTARGLGIVLVVLGHVEQGLTSSHLLDLRIWHPFDFSLYTFHMPLFMFLAGLNVPRSLAAGGARFVRSKLLGIFYPYLLWSALQWLANAAFARVTNNPATVRQLAGVFWDPIPPFWFLYALFLFSLGARILPQRFFLALSIVAFPAGELFFRHSFAHRLLHFPVFFALGMLFGSRWKLGRIPPVLAVSGLLVAAADIVLALRAGMQNYDSVLLLPAAAGGTVAMLWIAQLLADVQAMAWIGRISLAIYVMHIVAASGIRIVLQKVLHMPHIGWAYVVLGTCAGVGVPALVYWFSGRSGLLPWMGLKFGPRGRRWVDTGSTQPESHTA